MSITDNVINIALLGTANREMTSGELPEDLVGILERLKENAADGEEVFYKGAAAFFAMQHCRKRLMIHGKRLLMSTGN